MKFRRIFNFEFCFEICDQIEKNFLHSRYKSSVGKRTLFAVERFLCHGSYYFAIALGFPDDNTLALLSLTATFLITLGLFIAMWEVRNEQKKRVKAEEMFRNLKSRYDAERVPLPKIATLIGRLGRRCG